MTGVRTLREKEYHRRTMPGGALFVVFAVVTGNQSVLSLLSLKIVCNFDLHCLIGIVFRFQVLCSQRVQVQ